MHTFSQRSSRFLHHAMLVSLSMVLSIVVAFLSFSLVSVPLSQRAAFPRAHTASSSLFFTGFESGDPQLTWANTVDSGNSANIGGICCNLTGPELGTRN